MTQVATVEKILRDGYVQISVPRKSACGHDCEECAGCGMTGASVYAEARDPVGVRPGDKVVVESSTRAVLAVTWLVYMLPVVFFLLGYFLSRQFLLCFTPAVRRITATALGQASQDAQCTLFVQAEKLTLLQRGSVLTMEKPTFAAKRASRTALCLYGTNAEMLTLPRELADETNMQKFFS